MLVKDWMKKDVITIDAHASVIDAVHLLKEKGIRRLPVLKNGKLVGIVTDRDLKDFTPSRATTLDIYELRYLLSKASVEEAMTADPITVGPDIPIENVAAIMRDKKISGLPVLEKNGDLVGIITESDVFDVLVALTGVRQGGIRICLPIEDKSGSAKEVADVLRKHGGKIEAILINYEGVAPGYRDLIMRFKGGCRDFNSGIIEKSGGKVYILNQIIDFSTRFNLFWVAY